MSLRPVSYLGTKHEIIIGPYLCNNGNRGHCSKNWWYNKNEVIFGHIVKTTDNCWLTAITSHYTIATINLHTIIIGVLVCVFTFKQKWSMFSVSSAVVIIEAMLTSLLLMCHEDHLRNFCVQTHLSKFLHVLIQKFYDILSTIVIT